MYKFYTIFIKYMGVKYLMKFTKAIIGLCIIICILFTVSCACASDLSENMTDEISASEDNQVIEVNDDNEVMGDIDNGTYAALEEKIKAGYGSTIELENDYEYNDTLYGSGIIIEKNITIDGKNHKIDAKENGRVFYITGNNVVLKNIIFVNSHNDGNGGAIYGTGKNVEFLNCTFINNTAFWGAAIYWEDDGNCSISDCRFENNTANNGGVVTLWQIADCSISDCIFVNNNASMGGAIFWQEIANSSIYGCIFENNTVLNFGGGIYFLATENCTVSSSNFRKNSAKGNVGGAIATSHSINTVICNCDFADNYAKKGGGAIHSTEDENMTVCDCIFTDNNATNGTIYYDNFQESNITIINNIFLNNNGGAIVFLVDNPCSNTNGNWYGHNSTNYLSGADAPAGTCDTWLFLNGTANPSQIERLGTTSVAFALYVYNSTDNSISDAALTRNVVLAITPTEGNVDKKAAELNESIQFTSTGLKSAITAEIGKTTQIIEISVLADSFEELNKLINNSAEGSTITLEKDYLFTGGDNAGIVINKNITIDGNGHVIDGADQSRIFRVKSGNVTFKNLILQNGHNGGDSYGGAIWAEANTAVKAINCTFNNNSAKWGGASYNIYAENCTFNSNLARATGGAIFKGEALNCNFNLNNAQYGGAIAETNAIGCVFNSNYAALTGGAIYQGEAVNSTFISNTADNRGGGIYDGKATNCVFSGNNAKISGGALSYCYADSCIFKTNSDDYNETDVLSPIMTVENATIGFNSTEKYKFKFTTNKSMPIANANVSISVYYKENNTLFGNFSCLSGEGWAVNMPRGTYIAVFDTEYENFKPVNATITVVKGNSTLKVNDMAFDYGSTGSTTVEFINALNVTAEVVDHKEAVVTVNGTVITVSNLTAGTYTLKVTTITNDDYNNVTETAKITVNKLNAAITAESAAYVINYGGTYTVILKDANGIAFAGQTVTFTLNGKNIATAVTDAKGSASIKLTAAILKTAKAGARNLVISFAGDNIYNAASKTVKITINKEKTKIAAKKKTFKKSKKVKKYKITLKDSKGKAIKKAQVTIKIKKKTYKAKTNSKGKATFKIKKLTKKGTYKAKITYKGNSCYKKATKTVKIKIK